MLLVDEAAQVRDEIYNTVRPMLAATNGELWLMSTPNGKQGFFYDEWVNGIEPWLRILATAEYARAMPPRSSWPSAAKAKPASARNTRRVHTHARSHVRRSADPKLLR